RNTSSEATDAVVVYFHSGGMVLGDIDYEDNTARDFARMLGPVVVVNIEYRLAPEHTFPTGIEDAFAGLSWVKKNIEGYGGDPNRIAVVGQSAGAYLATVIGLRNAKSMVPPVKLCAMVSVTPMLDPLCKYPSATNSSFPVQKANQVGYWRLWLGKGKAKLEASDIYANPMLALDRPGTFLKNFPPTYVATVDSDVFRDEGDAFAEGLRNAEAVVEHHRFKNTVHGFFGMGFPVRHGMQVLEESVAFVRKHCL
ncbi:unnamed protein product, partial [Heterosigma akashiwo]